MRVSVVVIGLNEAAGIEAALRSSVAAIAELGGEGEVIYVDAGSTDDSRERARGVDGVRMAPVIGGTISAARARNRGLGLARFEWVQFLDGDMVLERGWFASALERTADRELAGIGGRLCERHLFGTVWNLAFGSDWPDGAERTATLGGAGLWRRAALIELGGFDVRLPVGEDPDLSLRARRAGWKVERIPAAMAGHDLGLDSLRGYLRRGIAVGVSQALVARRHGSFGGARRRALRAPLRAATYCGLASLAAVLGSWLPLLPMVGLWMRRAVRERRSGRPWRQALVHAAHVYLVDLPIAWGCLSARWRTLGVSSRDKVELALTSQGSSPSRP